MATIVNAFAALGALGAWSRLAVSKRVTVHLDHRCDVVAAAASLAAVQDACIRQRLHESALTDMTSYTCTAQHWVPAQPSLLTGMTPERYGSRNTGTFASQLTASIYR